MHPTVHQELLRLRQDEMERRLVRAALAPAARPGIAARLRARLRPIAFQALRIPAAQAPRAGAC